MTWLDQTLQDLRVAVRSLAKQRGFTAVIVLILALGIGAATAMYSVVDAVVLQPMAYEQPGRLVQAYEVTSAGAENAVSPGVFSDWRRHGTQFEGFAAYTSIAMNLTGGGDPVRLSGMLLSANGLQLLRAHPVLGRNFTPDEDQPNNSKVVVLAYELWQSRFGGAADVLGRLISLNDESYAVVGVLPPDFLSLMGRPQFVIPYVFRPGWTELREGHFLRVYARLQPGISPAQGREELAAIAQRTQPLFPAWKRGWSASITPLAEHLVRDVKPALLVLLGAVGFLLAIACANVANLLLARAAGREKEFGVRAALGAGRGRIFRQLLVESVLLSLLGGSLGVAAAFWATGALRRLSAILHLPRAPDIGLNPAVLGIALAAAVLTGILFGLAPALRASRTDLNRALKDATQGSGRDGARLRSGLIVAEIGLSLVLLVGAGLLLRSFSLLLRVAPGFEAGHVLTLQLSLPIARYPDNNQETAFYLRACGRIAALPGVTAAGCVDMSPVSEIRSDRFFRIPGWARDRDPGFDADVDVCTPDYFRALAIPLQQGRFFTAQDFAQHRPVALVNRAMAQACFAGEDPIGRQLTATMGGSWTIVGVVGDVRSRGLAEPARPTVFLDNSFGLWRDAMLVVRAAGSPLALAEPVRKAILELDSAEPVSSVRTLGDIVEATLAVRWMTIGLLAFFALSALFLAGFGLYGVVAYAVGQRTREFGIRSALGASQHNLLGLVLRHGLMLSGLGLTLGLGASFGLTRLLRSFLYAIQPGDPLTFAAASLLLLGAALLACLLPARRAARVDPLVALRAE